MGPHLTVPAVRLPKASHSAAVDSECVWRQDCGAAFRRVAAERGLNSTVRIDRAAGRLRVAYQAVRPLSSLERAFSSTNGALAIRPL